MQVPFVDETPQVADMSRHPTFVREGQGDFYDGLLVRFDPSVKVARDGRLGIIFLLRSSSLMALGG
jgi:hypothetical protein